MKNRKVKIFLIIIFMTSSTMTCLFNPERKRSVSSQPPVEIFIHFNGEDHSVLSKEICELGGYLIKMYKPLNLLLVEILPTKIPEIEQIGGKISPNRKFYGCLDQSVEIIKPTASWTALELQLGHEINGTGINISIVDTGINSNHWDLDDLDDNPATTDPKILAEWDFANDDANAMDDHGHGTHIAGIVAGTGNRSSGLYTGVAPGANLLNAKVLDENNQGTESDIIDGVLWSVTHGAHVINLSLASPESGNGTDALSLAVDWAVQQGVTVIIASGSSSGYYQVGKPGVANLGITVGATNDADGITTLGGFGPTLDFRLKPEVCAPGVDIIACRAGLTGDLTIGSPVNDHYTEVDGASQAAAHVAGVAALLLQAHPTWTPTDVKGALMSTAAELGDDVYKRGAGRIDAVASTNTSLLTNSLLDLQLFGGNTTYSTPLVLKNIENHAVPCDLSAGATISFNTSTFSIPALSTRTVNVTYTPDPWDAYHQEEIIRIAHEGKESRVYLCHIYPQCTFEPTIATIPYNGSFGVAGNVTLDEYLQTDLINLSLEVWAGSVRLATQPITSTEVSYNLTTLQNSSLYKGTHSLQVRLVQNGAPNFINTTDLTVQGWASTISIDEITVRRGSSVRLEWTLTDPEEFVGSVDVYIMDEGWVLLGTSSTGSLELTANFPPDDYQIRLEFSGDPIHDSDTTTTTLHVLPRDFRLLVWLLIIAAVIGVTVLILIAFNRRKPTTPARKPVQDLIKKIKEKKAQPPEEPEILKE